MTQKIIQFTSKQKREIDLFKEDVRKRLRMAFEEMARRKTVGKTKRQRPNLSVVQNQE